ncbi:MAG: M23 family metallopeptidase [Bacteroidales bacterium]|jgi:murein DD-endopeptidase MepM/ murein hydrolase activator NlpD|nr:M23 family metallopeptidase [Bacteroidales bacterium]
MEKSDKKNSRNYRLSLIDAVSHERLWSVRFTKPIFIGALVSGIVVAMVVFFVLVAYTPMRTFIPGYPSAQTRRQAVQNAQKIDSLEMRLLQWQLYSENLRRIVAGEAPIRLDSVMLGRENSRDITDAQYYAIRDSLLRADVLTQEQFNVDDSPKKNLPMEALSFFPPVKGVVSEGFERTIHPYIDITAPAGSMVTSVLDGTVVHTSWDPEDGYLIVIQHDGDILSLYKHNQKLLHRQGDVVKAGTPIGLVAESESLTKGNHLHFELWYEGQAMDPTQFIKF